MSDMNNLSKQQLKEKRKEKKKNKPGFFRKNKSIENINEKNANNNPRDEFENIVSDDNKKKITLFDRLNFILREDDFKDYIWLIDEEAEENKDKINNPKNMKNDDLFMNNRLTSTIIYSLIFLIFLATFYIVNALILHLNISLALYGLVYAIFVFIIFKKNYFKLRKEFNKRRNEVYNSFPLWVSTLQILIISNNVTNTFKKSLPTCPKAFKKDLEEFVDAIEFDPDNKEHYKNFLRKYKIDDVSEIIMDMYIFNRMDKNEIVRQFSVVNERLNKIQNNIRQKKQDQALFFISALNSIPLLTASIYVLIISMLLSSV